MKIHNYNELKGLDKILQWTSIKLQNNTFPTVSMFVGPSGTGKSSLAKLIALTLVHGYDVNSTEYKKASESIIDRCQNTEDILLYNLSNMKEEDQILSIRSAMMVSSLNTKNKVIILDEAQGLSIRAQDAFLTTFESLPDGVYVIVCTTSKDFQDQFVGRCIKVNFTKPNKQECLHLAETILNEKALQLAMPKRQFLAYVCSMCNYEPRSIVNLIEALGGNDGIITLDTLDVFLDLSTPKQWILLLDCIVNKDLVRGVGLINDMDISNDVPLILGQILECILGGVSPLLGADDIAHLREVWSDPEPVIRFTAEMLSGGRFNRAKLLSSFLKFFYSKPIETSKEQNKIDNAQRVSADAAPTTLDMSKESDFPSLDALLATAGIAIDN